jgi:putative effector of murein hydrolase LrgA (UPF0299 family)
MRRREGALVLGIFVVYLLVFSKSTNFNPLTNDGRYLTPFLALWLVPLAVWIDHELGCPRPEGRRLIASLALYGMLFLSVRNAFMHVAFSWGYDLNYAELLNMSTPVPNVMLLARRIFPNAPDVWYIWLLLAPPAALLRFLAR